MKRKVIKNAGKNPGLAACVDPLSSLCRQLALRQRLSPLSRLHDRGDAGNVTELDISLIGCNAWAFSLRVVIVQMWKNNTNFLDSGPYIDLPAYHPIRLFNIFIGGLYIVVVPFVYFRIFR